MVAAFEKPSLDFASLPDPALIANVEAEEAIIGGVLVDPNAIARVSALQPAVFSVSAYRKIWQVCLDLHAADKGVELLSVQAKLRELKQEEEVVILYSLLEGAVSAVNIDQYAELITKKWQQREAIKATQRAARLASDPAADLSEVRRYLERKLAEIEAPAPRTLEDSIREAIASNPTPSQKQVTILKLASDWSVHAKEIEKLWGALAAEVEAESDRDDNAAELDSLLTAKQARLDIHRILPTALATPIERLANELGQRNECFLTALLVTNSTLPKNQTWVRLWDATDFEVTPNLFGGIVAEPSQYKSPILRAIATKPLSKLQKQAKEEYQEALKQYAIDSQEWEESDQKDPDSKPVAPIRRLYYFTGATSEGIIRQFNECPEAGLLNLVDELAGKFKSANQYRGGRGSDEEDLLSLYDGTGNVILRASGIKADLEDGLNFGLLGSIQPKVLAKLMRDCCDSNGNWARFLFVNQPVATAEWHRDSISINLTEMLADMYRTIAALPARTYTLSPNAKERFRKARNRAEKLRVNEKRPGMAHYWGKVPGRIGKLALNLHFIWSYFDGVEPSLEIPYERVRQAEALCKFYADQMLSIYGDFEDPQALAPQLAKIIELATSTGLVTIRDIGRTLKVSSQRATELAKELEAMGRGRLTKLGKSLRFELSPNVTGIVTNPVTVENLTQQEPQRIVTIVPNVTIFSGGETHPEFKADIGVSEPISNTSFSETVETIVTIPQNVEPACVPIVTEIVTESVTIPDRSDGEAIADQPTPTAAPDPAVDELRSPLEDMMVAIADINAQPELTEDYFWQKASPFAASPELRSDFEDALYLIDPLPRKHQALRWWNEDWDKH